MSSTQLSTGNPFDMPASDVVAHILGAQAISLDGFTEEPVPAIALKGFGAEPMHGSTLRPGFHFTSVHDVPDSAAQQQELRKHRRRMAWIRWATLSLIVIAVGLGGFWLGANGRPKPTAASSQWHAVGVGAQGVIVRTDGLSVLIAPGELLPNGETLQQVIPEKSTYVSDHATVIVQPSAEAGAAPSTPAVKANKKH